MRKHQEKSFLLGDEGTKFEKLGTNVIPGLGQGTLFFVSSFEHNHRQGF
jgi:hypothetical protein